MKANIPKKLIHEKPEICILPSHWVVTVLGTLALLPAEFVAINWHVTLVSGWKSQTPALLTKEPNVLQESPLHLICETYKLPVIKNLTAFLKQCSLCLMKLSKLYQQTTEKLYDAINISIKSQYKIFELGCVALSIARLVCTPDSLL